LGEALGQMWTSALRWAALEVFEGIYTAEQLAAMVDREALLETYAFTGASRFFEGAFYP
jgi:hypothetical protein